MRIDQKRILLIDDDPDIHEAIKAILVPEGYAITSCWTGPSGLASMRREPPNLLLLDIMLATPTEGFQLAQEIREDPALAHVPIIMISALGKTTGMDYAGEVDKGCIKADLFLEKPLEAQVLRDAVNKLIADKE